MASVLQSGLRSTSQHSNNADHFREGWAAQNHPFEGSFVCNPPHCRLRLRQSQEQFAWQGNGDLRCQGKHVVSYMEFKWLLAIPTSKSCKTLEWLQRIQSRNLPTCRPASPAVATSLHVYIDICILTMPQRWHIHHSDFNLLAEGHS